LHKKIAGDRPAVLAVIVVDLVEIEGPVALRVE
jgi:hypothetical protein